MADASGTKFSNSIPVEEGPAEVDHHIDEEEDGDLLQGQDPSRTHFQRENVIEGDDVGHEVQLEETALLPPDQNDQNRGGIHRIGAVPIAYDGTPLGPSFKDQVNDTSPQRQRDHGPQSLQHIQQKKVIQDDVGCEVQTKEAILPPPDRNDQTRQEIRQHGAVPMAYDRAPLTPKAGPLDGGPLFKDQVNFVSPQRQRDHDPRDHDLQARRPVFLKVGDRDQGQQQTSFMPNAVLVDSVLWADAAPIDEARARKRKCLTFAIVVGLVVALVVTVAVAVRLSRSGNGSPSSTEVASNDTPTLSPSLSQTSQPTILRQATFKYNCSLPGLETLTPGGYANVKVNYLSYATNRSSPNFPLRAQEFEACTGGKISFAEAGNVWEDPVQDLGTKTSRGSEVYDGYFMSYSHFPEVSALGLAEHLNERIRQDNGKLKWEDVLPKVRTMGEYRKDGITNIDFLMYDGE